MKGRVKIFVLLILASFLFFPSLASAASSWIVTFTTATDPLGADYIDGIVADTMGRKWIATYGGGFSVLDDNGTLADKTDDRWQKFSSQDMPTMSDIIYTVAIDNTGKKWIGGHIYALFVLDDHGTPFDKSDDQWGSFTTDSSGDKVKITNSIVIDANQRKWLAQWGGVSVLDDHGTPFDKSDDQWITFTTADGLVNNMVWNIVLDSAGRKWFSTSGGVSVLDDHGTPFDKSDDQWVTFTAADVHSPNFTSMGLMKIDDLGRKWFSTNGGGFCVLDDHGTPFDKSDDRWQCFGTADGAGTNYPQAMYIEPTGRKWITGGVGVTLFDDHGTPFDKSDDHYRVFGPADGITSGGTWVITAIGSDLWLGTGRGVSVLPNYLNIPVVPNQPPTANAGGPYMVDEGGSVVLNGSGSDPDGDVLTYAWDLDNNGTFETPGQSVTFSAAGMDGPSTKTVGFRVCDDKGACAVASTSINIVNVSPTVGAIGAPADPVGVGTTISVSASFTDPGVLDTHTAVWDWGDNSTTSGNVTETHGSGSVTGNHAYTKAGMYTLTLKVTDKDGASGQSVFQYVVVFDPTAGFVTGAGAIDSLTGRVHFEFVVKYLPGDIVPSGKSKFRSQVANIDFSSSSYQWLVISGQKAIFKGVGTNNGVGNYTFLVSTIDGQPDKYRIKITDNATKTVFYDNEPGALETADPTTALVGGSIIVH